MTKVVSGQDGPRHAVSVRFRGRDIVVGRGPEIGTFALTRALSPALGWSSPTETLVVGRPLGFVRRPVLPFVLGGRGPSNLLLMVRPPEVLTRSGLSGPQRFVEGFAQRRQVLVRWRAAEALLWMGLSRGGPRQGRVHRCAVAGGRLQQLGARPGLNCCRVKGALLWPWPAGPSREARCSSVEPGDWPLFGQLCLWPGAPLHSIWCTGRDGPVRWEGAGRSLLGPASRA